MTTQSTLRELALRAVKCKKTWVWADTMRMDSSHVSLDIRLPDFSDAATVKALLGLVRNAWRNPLIDVVSSDITQSTAPDTLAFKVTVNYDGLYFSGATDVEALVNALEAADRALVR